MKINKIYIPIIISISICIGIVLGWYIFSGSTYTSSDNRQKLNRLFDLIENEYIDQVNTDSIVDIAVTDILTKLDPHSFYISPKDKELMATSLNGEFIGIGITYNMLNDTLTVINTISDGPSQTAGIKAGDRILFANERKLFNENLPADTLMSILRGPLDSDIKLRIYRKANNKTYDFKFKRKNVPVKSIDAAIMLDKNTAYIKINRFAANTHTEFDSKIKKIKQLKPQNIIIDLRNNTGGFVEVSEKIIDEFLPENQIIVKLINKTEDERVVVASKNGELLNNKLFVLVDENTASASEIFAGAIQDNDRGLILGRRTYGKGLVQQELSLGDGSLVRLSVSKYHTPSGRSIQRPYTLGDQNYSNDYHNRLLSKELYSSDSIKIIDSTSFKSLNGRSILQANGGIVPDIFIPLADDYVIPELKLVMQSAFISNYLFQLIDNNREELTKNSYTELVSYFENTDYYYNKVLIQLNKYPLNFDPDEYKILIKRYINAELIAQLKSEDDYYRYLTPLDEEVQIVLKTIKSSELYTLLSKKSLD